MGETAMKYAMLGNSGIEGSRLCVGCMGFGDPASREGRLERQADTPRSQTDKTAVSKCDGAQQADYAIALRVDGLAQSYGATATRIAPAWQFAKGVAAPIVGAAKARHTPHKAAGALPDA